MIPVLAPFRDCFGSDKVDRVVVVLTELNTIDRSRS
jgi:hypothetical protein